EGLRTERPRARVVAHEEKGGEAEEDEWPVARRRRPARAVGDGEHAHDEDEGSRHVMVELAPLTVRVGARSETILEGHVLQLRRGERGQAGREYVRHLGRGGPI